MIADGEAMRWLSGLVLAAFSMARPAEACSVAGNASFTSGPHVESLAPGPVNATVVKIARSEDHNTCSASTIVIIDVTATDDTTPTIDLGYRLRIVSGIAPPRGYGDTEGDRLGNQQWLIFSGAVDLDFELGIAAIDKSGNLGPETVIPIYDEAPEAPGCNAGGSTSSTLTVGLALLALRRRRRSH